MVLDIVWANSASDGKNGGGGGEGSIFQFINLLTLPGRYSIQR